MVTRTRLCVTFVHRIRCLSCVNHAGIESFVVYSMTVCTSDYCPQSRIWFLLGMRQYACARFGGEWRVTTADSESILTMHSLGARYSKSLMFLICVLQLNSMSFLPKAVQYSIRKFPAPRQTRLPPRADHHATFGPYVVLTTECLGRMMGWKRYERWPLRYNRSIIQVYVQRGWKIMEKT